jgi:flagellin
MKENPMSLGVLNNLSAVFAENNLNNTQNSLNTTLQQLSSGSKINSGADDPAGLSLVDGLAANQAALTQSATNATEGVGLLQVADGALSQVTSLLNTAVTLATEASNGTLDSSQEAAANQEYQSILSEIDNIGTTTTYNQEQVFNGSTVNIYTGDSSSTGSSIDALSIGSLSSSSVGQTDGTMGYSTGANDFIDLSTATANAQSTDSLSATADSLAITYVVGMNGSTPVTATATITPTTDTIQGMISAIDNSGLGISASFTTGTAAGDSAAGSETGIEITGDVVDAAPTAVGQVEITPTVTDSSTTEAATTATLDAGGTPTISYTSQAGENLSSTSLDNSTDAQSALTAINSAISDVAAQDGYVGAQINTLNAISSVESTQQENIESAQNAVQATDYAAATSNLSKYEILTQTGISALAQANSVEQEVTKLLQ